MRKTVLSFGETLWELPPSGPVLGGAPLNLAFRAHSLGERAVLVSRIGRDHLGRDAWHRIAALGIEMESVQWDSTWPTGTVLVTTGPDRNPHELVVPRVAFDFVEPTDAVLTLAATAECICFGTLCQRAPTSRRTLEDVLARCRSGLKLLDLNLRNASYSRDGILALLERADVLKLNEDEAHRLADLLGLTGVSLPAIAEQLLRRWSLACCVITLGERGAFAADAEGERVYVPGYQVQVADLRGTGDAFTAGFIHRRLQGASLRECCRLGNVLGAIVAGQRGAFTPVTGDAVRRFVDAPPPRLRHEELCEPARV